MASARSSKPAQALALRDAALRDQIKSLGDKVVAGEAMLADRDRTIAALERRIERMASALSDARFDDVNLRRTQAGLAARVGELELYKLARERADAQRPETATDQEARR